MPFASRSPWLALASAVPLLLSACREPDPVTIQRPSRPRLGAQLSRSSSCAALEDALRGEARAHVEARAYELAEAYGLYGVGEPIGIAYGDAGAASSAPTTAGGDATVPSETNVQVAGIDELDFVDTTGDRTYLIHGNTLRVLDSSPADALHELGTLELPGWPEGLMVAGDRAIVVSNVAGSGNRPDGLAVVDAGTLGGGGELDGGGAPADGGSAGDAFEPNGVHVLVLDLSSDTPVVLARHALEGSLVGARRHDDVGRVVVRRTPSPIDDLAVAPSPWDPNLATLTRDRWTKLVIEWRDEALARLDARPLEDLLPHDFVWQDGGWAAASTPCDSYYLQDRGAAREGFVTVMGFDVRSPATVATTTVVGGSSVMHASRDALVLAYGDAWTSDVLRPEGPATTILRRFALDGIATVHEASGAVYGGIASSYAIDATADRTRVVTHSSSAPTGGVVTPAIATEGDVAVAAPTSTAIDGTVVRVLRRDGDSLVEVGSTPALAPGETVQAVRFVDSKVYVVTFRRVDPLFVVDLSTDTPVVLGELTMPGFSTYVHPLDAGHLLTIGFTTDPFGRVTGVALRVFDVSVPSAPSLLHELAVSGWSGATYDPHDFIFDAGTGLLAIPITAYESTLSLFHVSVADGIVAVGSVDHATFATPCPEWSPATPYATYVACNPWPQIRRGLFLADGLLAIGDSAVTAHALPRLGPPLASVKLPPTNWYYGFVGGL